MNTMIPISSYQKERVAPLTKTVFQSQKTIQQRVIQDSENQMHFLQNYLGNHNNLKLQFKNKKYRKIYYFLSKNAPLQSIHIPLYLQDKLFALIKIIKTSLIHKETSLFQYLQPYFQKSKECILALYQFNLTDKKIIQKTKKVNMELASRSNQFFYIVINFVHLLATFYRSKGVRAKAKKYYEINSLICRKLYESSTSSCRIRRKISQILISYSAFLIQIKCIAQAQQILHIALKNAINLLGILQMRLRYEPKQSIINRKMLQCFRFMCSIYLNFAICFQIQKKSCLVYASLLEVKLIQEIIQKRYGFKNKISQFIKKPKEIFEQHCQISAIISNYFNLQEIKGNLLIQQKSNNILQNYSELNNNQKIEIIRYETFDIKKKKKTQERIRSKHSINSRQSHNRKISDSISIDKNQKDLNILLYGVEYLSKSKSNINKNLQGINSNTKLQSKENNFIDATPYSYKKQNFQKNLKNNYNENYPQQQSKNRNGLVKKKKQIKFWSHNNNQDIFHQKNYKKLNDKLIQQTVVNSETIQKAKEKFILDDQIQKCKIFRLKCKSHTSTKKLEDITKLTQNIHNFPVKMNKFHNCIQKEFSSLIKSEKKDKNNWNETGIKLFKKIIFKHKKQFGVTKMDLFINTNQHQTAQIKLIQRESLLMVQYNMNSEQIKMRIQQNMKDLIQENIINSSQNEKKVKKINKAISEYEKNKHLQQFNSRIQQSYGRIKGKSLRFNFSKANQFSKKQVKIQGDEKDQNYQRILDPFLLNTFSHFSKNQVSNPKLFLTSFCTSPKAKNIDSS